VRRRDFIALVGSAAAAWPLAARAQTKTLQIGFLYPGADAGVAPRLAAFRSGLQSVGLREDQVAFVVRGTGGDADKLAAMVSDLVRRKVDLIHAVSPLAERAAQAATTTIPIIAGDLESDPVADGFVASIAHPGGNLTGVFLDFPDFGKKWLEFLKELLPQVTKVAVFWDPTTVKRQLDAVKSAAELLGLTIDTLEVRDIADAEAAFSTAEQRGAGAVILLPRPLVGSHTKAFADLALAHRLPSITLFTDFARDGGLMAYGPNLLANFRQEGVMAGKILQGAAAADLPVEALTKFEFVLNIKTAKQLNVKVPASVLLRADEVIE
jgi:putative tryptophan/tyrosine transport system substrate-binding protein